MPQIDYKQLRKDIQKNQISPVYFLYGEEKYLLKKLLASLIKQIKPTSFEALNFNEMSNENTVDEIADASMALPFMSEKKCVLVNDFNIESKNQSELNKLEDLLNDTNESTVLIFALPTLLIDTKKSAKWRKFIKLMETKFVCVNFSRMTSGDLASFVMKICEQNGSKITKQNANKIVEYSGFDMKNLSNEAKKLASFTKEREITIDDIENLVVKNMETTVFILIKSIIANDYAKAYSLLDLLFSSGETAVPILARIAETYIDLYRVRVAIESGKNSSSPLAYGDYKGREFRLTNANRDIRNFSTEKLRKILDLLKESDILLKSSSLDGKIVLEELIAKLLIINKGGNIA